MAKARSIVEENTGSVYAAEPAASELKGSINLRIGTQTRQLIDEAAAVLGKTRTEFMIDSARALAIDVLLDQRLFVLDSVRYDAFVDTMRAGHGRGSKRNFRSRRN